MTAPVFHLGLTGWPLGHSLSPQIHTAALGALGVEGDYTLFPCPPAQRGIACLKALLDQVRRGSLHGLNVTLPHKQAVSAWVDELTGSARAVGAVNTLFLQGNRLVGDNTDLPAFLADLERLGFLDYAQDRPAWVLGAGGAARAVVWGLAQTGRTVIIAARRPEQGLDLARSLAQAQKGDNGAGQQGRIEAVSLDASALAALPPPGLIVNATPVGMAPMPEALPWPVTLDLPPGAAVYDLVYTPPETVLVQTARSLGLPAAGGLGMLVEQAALALERWTGCPAPRQVMLQAASKPLTKGML